jgi:hypothetical protein
MRRRIVRRQRDRACVVFNRAIKFAEGFPGRASVVVGQDEAGGDLQREAKIVDGISVQAQQLESDATIDIGDVVLGIAADHRIELGKGCCAVAFAQSSGTGRRVPGRLEIGEHPFIPVPFIPKPVHQA